MLLSTGDLLIRRPQLGAGLGWAGLVMATITVFRAGPAEGSDQSRGWTVDTVTRQEWFVQF